MQWELEKTADITARKNIIGHDKKISSNPSGATSKFGTHFPIREIFFKSLFEVELCKSYPDGQGHSNELCWKEEIENTAWWGMCRESLGWVLCYHEYLIQDGEVDCPNAHQMKNIEASLLKCVQHSSEVDGSND